MQCVYRASQTSETTSATITGLTAGARYAVLVTALDEAGKKLGVYEYRSFYTEDNGGWEPGPTDSDVSDDPDVSGEDGGNGDDGSGGAATGRDLRRCRGSFGTGAAGGRRGSASAR